VVSPIGRVVDAHIHLWDPGRADWYPYLAGQRELDMGDVASMCRLFDQETYRSESARWNVEKFVHVAAASKPHHVDETMELDEQADVTGHPDAIVGALNPSLSTAENADLLDRQMESSRFRGVRPMGGEPGVFPTADALQLLQERDLVFEVLARPDALTDVASRLAGFDDLTVVVEHAGWPRGDTDEEHALWRSGMAALAALGDHIHCKISGLSVPLQSMQASVFRRWVEYCLEVFGVDRCLFGSNFPVDGISGTYDDLYTTFDELTSDLDDTSREKLFAANAESVYRC